MTCSSSSATVVSCLAMKVLCLCERIRNMLPATPKIVLNLSGVDYIDSGGLGILVGLLVSARSRGGELKLVSPGKRVKDLLRRTNLHTIFGVYENNDGGSQPSANR